MNKNDLSFRLLSPTGLFGALGGREVFFPENDYLLSEGYPDGTVNEDGSPVIAHDVLGRKSWVSRGAGSTQVPGILAKFHYLDSDETVYAPRYAADNPMGSRFMTAWDPEGNLLGVLKAGNSGTMASETRNWFRSTGREIEVWWASYFSIRDDLPRFEGSILGMWLMEEFCAQVLRDGDVLTTDWIGDENENHPGATTETDVYQRVVIESRVGNLPRFACPVSTSSYGSFVDKYKEHDPKRFNLFLNDSFFWRLLRRSAA